MQTRKPTKYIKLVPTNTNQKKGEIHEYSPIVAVLSAAFSNMSSPSSHLPNHSRLITWKCKWAFKGGCPDFFCHSQIYKKWVIFLTQLSPKLEKIGKLDPPFQKTISTSFIQAREARCKGGEGLMIREGCQKKGENWYLSNPVWAPPPPNIMIFLLELVSLHGETTVVLILITYDYADTDTSWAISTGYKHLLRIWTKLKFHNLY